MRSLKLLCTICLIAVLSACGVLSEKPPQSAVKMAIAAQLAETQQSLAEQLGLPAAVEPNFTIEQVQVQDREQIQKGSSPTYHLRGTFVATLQIRDRQVEQESPFEVYLKAVPEEQGQTWMLMPGDGRLGH